ncbi:hypothetical protein GEMRC1_003282 [Eukaryota sp. GEM-RC1]
MSDQERTNQLSQAKCEPKTIRKGDVSSVVSDLPDDADPEEFIVIEVLNRCENTDGEHFEVLYDGGEICSVPIEEIEHTDAYASFIKLEKKEKK